MAINIKENINILDKFKSSKNIKVLMMGGRRCGKTSVLAALDACCQRILEDKSDLEVSCSSGTNALTRKKEELKYYFSSEFREKNGNMFTPDFSPSSDSTLYTYDVDVSEKNTGYTLEFQDFPGEWLTDPDYDKTLKECFIVSQVIVIAIDTPHLVEEIDEYSGVGKYHKEFNRVAQITEFFKTAFTDGKYNKLVVFVPLKCEKYYRKNDMKRVYELVKKGYPELFGFLSSSDVKEKCTVAISPILTIGGAEFLRFKEGSYVGQYCYARDPNERRYNPKACEQPLFLVLQYLVSISKQRLSNKGTVFNWFNNHILNNASLDDLVTCEKTIKEVIASNEDLPVQFVQDPLGMKR